MLRPPAPLIMIPTTTLNHFTNIPRFSSETLNTPSITSTSLSKSIPISPFFLTISRSSLNSPQYSLQSPPVKDQSNLELQSDWNVQVGCPTAVPAAGFSFSDRAFFLLAFIACSVTIGLGSFVIAAASALHAMGRAAVALSKLADTACEELPSTMAAVRLSGMEISDLTLELSDLSQEINDGMNKSAEVVQAAEAIGSLAHHQTMSMIEERANLPIISIKPIVSGAANKTRDAVGRATRAVLNILSRGEQSPRG